MELTRSISLREWLDTSADVRSRGAVGFMAGILIILLYVVIRFAVYALFPTEPFCERVVVGGVQIAANCSPRPRQVEWWVRDTIMDGPRLLATGLALMVGRYFWGLEQLGWHRRLPARGLIMGGVITVLLMLGSLFRAVPITYPARVLLVLTISSVVVALAEETLFRGVVFKGLDDWYGTSAALFGSTTLFTVYHVQAQPLERWPSIFCIGLIYAVLRWQGVGLVWLVISHAVSDSVIYLGTMGPPLAAWWDWMTLGLTAAVAMGYYVWAIRSSRD